MTRRRGDVGFLTDATISVGVQRRGHLARRPAGDVVDEDPDDIEQLADQEVDSEVASTWEVFEDGGGDRAYAAEVGDRVVLVYGSAPAEDLELVVERLTAVTENAGAEREAAGVHPSGRKRGLPLGRGCRTTPSRCRRSAVP